MKNFYTLKLLWILKVFYTTLFFTFLFNNRLDLCVFLPHTRQTHYDVLESTEGHAEVYHPNFD